MSHVPTTGVAADPAGRPGQPGTDDAVRATVGVIAAYGAALLVAGLVGLLAGDLGAGEVRTAGQQRAQLAVQALAFAASALLLIEGLRLGQRPGPPDPFVAERRSRPQVPVLTVVAAGVACAIGGALAGPIVAALFPGVTDPEGPVSGLGVGSGLGADLGTVLVVVALIPLGEELLFRGVLAGAWLRAGRPVIAVLSSTVLFGLAHATVGPRSILVTALLGALFAGALLVSGSLGAPVLAHALVNMIALLDAGLDDPAAVVLAAACVVAVTVVASRLSPLVSWPAPGGTLTG